MDSIERTVPSAQTVAASLTALCWYALPDVVRSRSARALAKVGLIGCFATVVWATGGYSAPQAPAAGAEDASPGDGATEPGDRQLAWPKLAIGSALLVAGAVGNVAVERRIFARGERRRLEGHRWGHLPVACLAAVAVGASMVLRTA